MSQFDVYANGNARTRELYPYLLDVQHDVLSDLRTRIVVPLGAGTRFDAVAMERLTPRVSFGGRTYVLMTPEMSAIAVHRLTSAVGTLADHRDDVLGAIDFATTGY